MSIPDRYLVTRRKIQAELDWYDQLHEMLAVLTETETLNKQLIAEIKKTVTKTERQKQIRSAKLAKAKEKLSGHQENIDMVTAAIDEINSRWTVENSKLVDPSK